MSRVITVGAAQLGGIQRTESRGDVVRRMLGLLESAAGRGCDLVVFPELALTTFFPRYPDAEGDLDAWFEAALPGPDTRPLFEAAREHGISFCLGYAELDGVDGRQQWFNTAVLVGANGDVVLKYRKVHLPGTAEVDPGLKFQHLEKRYFDEGDLGFPVARVLGGVLGMLICNDRRWPEAYRMLALQGVELIAIGYNTPAENFYTDEPVHLGMFHNHLCMQAGAYQNSAWVVGVAKAGDEDGHRLLGGSAIIAPSGEIVARARTEADELVVADCDLDAARFGATTIFDFGAHRKPAQYGLITERAGAVPPPE